MRILRYEDIGGLSCPTEEIVFNDKIGGSLSQCARKCSDFPSCFGVFHLTENNKCVGCGKQFPDKNASPILEGTSYFRRQTYVVVNDQKSWENAKINCESLGGHLVDIKTEQEETFIEHYVVRSFTEDSIWIGGTDTKEEGIYVWTDGTQLSESFTNWNPGQPDDKSSKPKPEDCLIMMNSQSDRKWGDVNCDLKRISLCELQ